MRLTSIETELSRQKHNLSITTIVSPTQRISHENFLEITMYVFGIP